jgi:hypothetical protein
MSWRNASKPARGNLAVFGPAPPLEDWSKQEPLMGFTALGGAMLAEAEPPAPDLDKGLTGPLVETVGWRLGVVVEVIAARPFH